VYHDVCTLQHKKCLFFTIIDMSKKQQHTYRSLGETARTKTMKVIHKYSFNSSHNFAVGKLIYKFENIVH